MNLLRRQLLRSFSVFVGLAGLNACAQSVNQLPSRMSGEADQVRMNRFQGVSGAEWTLSSVDELRWIEILDENGNYVEAPARMRPHIKSQRALNSIPIKLKVTWREQDPNNPVYSGNRNESWSGGKITGSFEIPVADRIPDELLDDLRRDPKGSLRIKVRLHREGVLLGWDIERRPRYDRNKRDIYGEAAYVGPVWAKTGGDFKEARFLSWVESADGTLVSSPDRTSLTVGVPPELGARGVRLRNGYLWEPGWYIHPKTGQRIETDF